MSYRDFVANFQRLEICYLGPDSKISVDEEDEDAEAHKWEGTLFEGGWKTRVNAGGCRNNRTSTMFVLVQQSCTGYDIVNRWTGVWRSCCILARLSRSETP